VEPEEFTPRARSTVSTVAWNRGFSSMAQASFSSMKSIPPIHAAAGRGCLRRQGKPSGLTGDGRAGVREPATRRVPDPSPRRIWALQDRATALFPLQRQETDAGVPSTTC